MIRNHNLEKTKEALKRLRGRGQKYQILLNQKKEKEGKSR